MEIFGVAILSVCYLIGQFIGDLLGVTLGINSNVGGVGFAMILLIAVTSYFKNKGMFTDKASKGIEFWQAMYIPIVVAMSAIQNVYSAISSGMVVFIVGVLVVVVSFAFIPVIDRIFPDKPTGQE